MAGNNAENRTNQTKERRTKTEEALAAEPAGVLEDKLPQQEKMLAQLPTGIAVRSWETRGRPQAHADVHTEAG